MAVLDCSWRHFDMRIERTGSYNLQGLHITITITVSGKTKVVVIMPPDFFKHNPFRHPEWRAERVIEMLENRAKPLRPRRYDDHYVRTYRRFLILYMAAGADRLKLDQAIAEWPYVYAAHSLRNHPDSERRQILEAWLLTHEPYVDIARRFATDERTIKYFESLFFNVRDRLSCGDWIAKIIRGPSEYLSANRHGTLTGEQRGFLYKLFAYHGGPLVLEALIAGLAPGKLSLCSENVADWLDEALMGHVRTRAVAAAMAFGVDRRNVMRLIKLAVKIAAKRRTGENQARHPDSNYVKKVAATLAPMF